MEKVRIDEGALTGMASLLGDQFNDTLQFCFSEFERLQQAFVDTMESDREAAIRNIHSLKSNAAQFGAVSLANTARTIEQCMMENDDESAKPSIAILDSQVEGSVSRIEQWLADS